MKSAQMMVAIVILAVLAAACAGPGSSPGTQQPPYPVATDVPLHFPLERLISLAPGDILVQQDYEPGLLRPEVHYPFGRVAPFTLFADGTLVYLEEGASYEQQRMLQVLLAPEEALALLQQVLDLGFGRLIDHTDYCRPTGETSPEGEEIIECVADAGTAILRARLPSGELHEVKIYADFANDPQAFQGILRLLNGYINPQAQPYVPRQATLFANSYEFIESAPISEWPLDPQRLAGLAPDVQQAWVLEGDELAAFLAAVPRNMGDFSFTFEDRVVHTFLVPWLPGVDHSREILADFPPLGPTQPRPTEAPFAGKFAECLQPASPAETGAFRVAYLDAGNLWFLDERLEPQRLAETGDAQQLRLSPDGELVVFVRREAGGTQALWAVNRDGSQLRRLAGAPELGGEIEGIIIAADNAMVAFSHRIDPFNAELWTADLDGSSARRLVSAPDLMGMLKEGGEPVGASPTSVVWIPKTATLAYDAHPSYAGDGIYTYIQRQNWVADARTGQLAELYAYGEGGAFSFSPDGNEVAIITPESLDLMNVEAKNRHPAGVDYHAVGFGHYYFHPPLAWAPDSQSLLLAQPAGEGYANDGVVEIWRIPVDGSAPERLSGFRGFSASFVFSPDQSKVAYWAAAAMSNQRELHVAAVDGTVDLVYASGELFEFLSWSPDSRHFVYRIAEQSGPLLGDLCGEPRPLEDLPGTWLDASHFLFTEEAAGGQGLYLGSLEGERRLLGVMEGLWVYDVAILAGER